jgi:hypothetical protein
MQSRYPKGVPLDNIISNHKVNRGKKVISGRQKLPKTDGDEERMEKEDQSGEMEITKTK